MNPTTNLPAKCCGRCVHHTLYGNPLGQYTRIRCQWNGVVPISFMLWQYDGTNCPAFVQRKEQPK